MSTRIKVFNYVMTADPIEVNQTLDEARALLVARRQSSSKTGTGTTKVLSPQARAAITKAKAKQAKLAADKKAADAAAKGVPASPAGPATSASDGIAAVMKTLTGSGTKAPKPPTSATL